MAPSFERKGTLLNNALLSELSQRGAIDVREAFIDASFAPAKKGVARSAKRNSTKIMTVADRNGLPVSVCAESASPHEGKLDMSTLLQMVVPEAPQNLIGDNAYDCDRLDADLRFYGIEVIAPHRRNRKN